MKFSRLRLVLCLGVGLLACHGCGEDLPVNAASGMNDVQFAEFAFKTWLRGDAAAESMIDYETLSLQGVDIGKLYRASTSEADKADTRRTTVTDLSLGLGAVGVNESKLSEWRLEDRDDTKTIVAFDTDNDVTFKLTIIQKDGKQLISGLE